MRAGARVMDVGSAMARAFLSARKHADARRIANLSWLGCGAVMLALGMSPSVTQAQVGIGDPFPPITTLNLQGNELPDTKGRVLLVDFWASWCAPCKASFPAFARLHTDYASRGLVIVAVSVDEKPAAYSAFVKKWNPPFLVVRDQEQKLVSAVKVPTMPTSYLIGPDGQVRAVHRGFHGTTSEAELRQTIEAVLNEKKQ